MKYLLEVPRIPGRHPLSWFPLLYARQENQPHIILGRARSDITFLALRVSTVRFALDAIPFFLVVVVVVIVVVVVVGCGGVSELKMSSTLRATGWGWVERRGERSVLDCCDIVNVCTLCYVDIHHQYWGPQVEHGLSGVGRDILVCCDIVSVCTLCYVDIPWWWSPWGAYSLAAR